MNIQTITNTLIDAGIEPNEAKKEVQMLVECFCGYTEKDRIIENTVYSVSLTIYLPPYEENSLLVFWRYVESINRMLEELETDVWHSIEMTKVTKSKMIFRIVS